MPTAHSCEFDYLLCGQTLTASNANRARGIGSPAGDPNFLVVLFEPQTITASTCSKNTAIDAEMYLYDACPSLNTSTQLANNHPNFECGMIRCVGRGAGAPTTPAGAAATTAANYLLAPL